MSTAARCPITGSERKTDRSESAPRPGTVRLRSYAALRQVLRDPDATRQAGFNAELANRTGLRPPVLFEDGATHRQHRIEIARFFTPKRVDSEYRALMERVADDAIGELTRRGSADVADLSLSVAMRVAAQVVGLTNSQPAAMARRLERILSLERLERLPRIARAVALLRANAHVIRFMAADVRPAIRARRKAPQDDVISHLLAKGYRDPEILIECITYGAAGMATTREFIVIAAWHLLERADLRARYLNAPEAERHAILHEILRLEPVVGRLYRRTTSDFTLRGDDGVERVIPAGTLLDLDVRAANADPAAVGAEALCLRPDRERAERVQEPVMAFGDGAHRCPGAFIAIAESDAFLTRLLRLPLRRVGEPRIAWNDLIEGYEVRGLRVDVDPVAQ
jgi:cytochrome P450